MVDQQIRRLADLANPLANRSTGYPQIRDVVVDVDVNVNVAGVAGGRVPGYLPPRTPQLM